MDNTGTHTSVCDAQYAVCVCVCDTRVLYTNMWCGCVCLLHPGGSWCGRGVAAHTLCVVIHDRKPSAHAVHPFTKAPLPQQRVGSSFSRGAHTDTHTQRHTHTYTHTHRLFLSISAYETTWAHFTIKGTHIVRGLSFIMAVDSPMLLFTNAGSLPLHLLRPHSTQNTFREK